MAGDSHPEGVATDGGTDAQAAEAAEPRRGALPAPMTALQLALGADVWGAMAEPCVRSAMARGAVGATADGGAGTDAQAAAGAVMMMMMMMMMMQ